MMRKGTFCFFTASLSITLLSTQALQAQTNTGTGVEALESNTTGINNTATGYRALRFNTTGNFNTAHGAEALRSNTTGFNNTAVGHAALSLNTTGFYNTAMGDSSLVSNTTGSQNTAYGTFSLAYNTTGFFNTAVGVNALVQNTTGQENTSVGFASLVRNSTGSGNTATGRGSMFGNVTGSFNTATGMGSMRLNVGGNENSTHGYFSLLNNSTGSQNTSQGAYSMFSNTTGYNNTAQGYQALYSNTTGIFNTAQGYQALSSNTTGLENVATGYSALRFLRTGFFNTASGDYALYSASETFNNTASGALALSSLTTGHHNTALGKEAGSSFNPFGSTFVGANADATTNVINSTALGYGAMVTGDNQVRIGNTAVTSIGGEVNWTAFSDGRFKKNLKEDIPGLSFITKLRPVTYTLDVSGIDSKLKVKQGTGAGVKLHDETARLIAALQPSAEEQKAKAEKAKVVYTGFVAQEVEEAAKALNYDFSGVDKPKNNEDFYGLRYGDFVVPLVKSVQELAKKAERVDELEVRLQQQQQQISELKDMVTKLLNSHGGNVNNTTATISGAYLKQNVPNPHNGNTVIQYSLPQNTTSAQIMVTNSKGQVLKTIALNSRGDGQVSLQAGSLPSGTYTYSLWIDGIQADTKQMIIVK